MALEYSDVEIYIGSDRSLHFECICGHQAPILGWPITVNEILEEFDGHEAECKYH